MRSAACAQPAGSQWGAHAHKNTALPPFPGHQQPAWSPLKWPRITRLGSRQLLGAAHFWQRGTRRTYPTANLSAFALRWNIAICHCIELKWQFSSARNSSSFFASSKMHYTRTFNVGFAKSGSLMSLSCSSSVLSHNCHCNKHYVPKILSNIALGDLLSQPSAVLLKAEKSCSKWKWQAEHTGLAQASSSPPVAAQTKPTPLSDIGFSLPMSWWSTAKKAGCPVNLRSKLTVTLPSRWAKGGDIARLVNAHLPAGTQHSTILFPRAACPSQQIQITLTVTNVTRWSQTQYIDVVTLKGQGFSF